MPSVSNNTVVELFKTVYGEMHQLVPDSQILSRDIAWAEGDKVGDVLGSQPDGGQAGTVLPDRQHHPFASRMTGDPQRATGPVLAGEGRAVPR